MERFRGNVWLDGLAPFAEFDLVGRDLRIGEARARACASGSPAARRPRSIPTPASATPTRSARSQAGWGHQDFGVYAEVIAGGRVAVGDRGGAA